MVATLKQLVQTLVQELNKLTRFEPAACLALRAGLRGRLDSLRLRLFSNFAFGVSIVKHLLC
jgi:hypothetical protein